MKKIFLDQYTKDQATEYADTEASIHGFERGGEKWKKAFQKYLSFAVSTISVGRNPINKRNPRDMQVWPEIFSDAGFSGKVARNYKGKKGEHPKLREIQERVKSCVSSLVYMYMNGIFNIRTTTTNFDSGKISAEEMSDLQLRGSDENLSKEEAHAQNIDIMWNQLAMTVIETACYEFLLPFFMMKPEDVRAILDGVKFEGNITPTSVAEARTEMEKRLRAAIGDKVKNQSLKKLVFG